MLAKSPTVGCSQNTSTRVKGLRLSTKTLYEILEVASTAPLEEIKGAYRRQAMKWHPDRNPGNLAEAERRFKEIGSAYKVLSDPEARAEYDAAQGSQQSQSRYSETHQQSQSSDSSREDADSTFFDEMLDLAFELSRRGYPLDKILKMLLALDCPESVARAVAKRFEELGATSHAQPNSQSKSAKSPPKPPSEDDSRVPRDIMQADWEVVAPYYAAYLGKPIAHYFEANPNDHYLMAFESYHRGNALGFWKKFSFRRFLASGLWLGYRKQTLPAIVCTVLFILSTMVTDSTSVLYWITLCITYGIPVWLSVSGTRILYRSATESISGVRGLANSKALPRLSAEGKPSNAAWIGMLSVLLLISVLISVSATDQSVKRQKQIQAERSASVNAAIRKIEYMAPELDSASPNFNQAGVNYIIETQKHFISQGVEPDEALWKAYNLYAESRQ